MVGSKVGLFEGLAAPKDFGCYSRSLDSGAHFPAGNLSCSVRTTVCCLVSLCSPKKGSEGWFTFRFGIDTEGAEAAVIGRS